ncbi:hypothetical protein [Microvirga sp. M2]|uniref:hypothetical protein n=1 Tax=Microvirga sp. M2 TaxID=3073270 RepID=UPI0039C38171
MVRFAGLLALPLLASVAWAEGVPRFDIAAMCRAAPRLDANDKDTDKNCVRDETEARTELEREWAGYDARLRARCTSETRIGGSPSYVEVLTCIQEASANAPPAAQRRARGK